jgi:hypothetical protein
MFFQGQYKTMRDHSEGSEWAVGSELLPLEHKYTFYPGFYLSILYNPYVVSIVSLNEPRKKQHSIIWCFLRFFFGQEMKLERD